MFNSIASNVSAYLLSKRTVCATDATTRPARRCGGRGAFLLKSGRLRSPPLPFPPIWVRTSPVFVSLLIFAENHAEANEGMLVPPRAKVSEHDDLRLGPK